MNDQGRPWAALVRCSWSERGNRDRVGQRPAFLCSPVPGLDSAGLPNSCGA